jgi:hypothetical protein
MVTKRKSSKFFADPAHPIWILARILLRVGVVAGCLAFVYKQLDSRDLVTLLIFTLGDIGISKVVRPPLPTDG